MKRLVRRHNATTKGVLVRAGFTLVEVLVALAALALMATLAWRGLDGMLRARDQLRTHTDDLTTLQAALAQWQDDLDALHNQPGLPTLDWNGRMLRLVRSDAEAQEPALRVVGWTLHSIDTGSRWVRISSGPLRERTALQQAWQRMLAPPQQDDGLRQTDLSAVDDWQVYYFRSNSWSNPQSSAGDASPIPDGVRLVLHLHTGQALSGRMLLDWVRPGFGGGN